MPLWRTHDVSQLLCLNRERLHEVARRADIIYGMTWTLDELHRLVQWQLREGTETEQTRAAEALAALDASAFGKLS